MRLAYEVQEKNVNDGEKGRREVSPRRGVNSVNQVMKLMGFQR